MLTSLKFLLQSLIFSEIFNYLIKKTLKQSGANHNRSTKLIRWVLICFNVFLFVATILGSLMDVAGIAALNVLVPAFVIGFSLVNIGTLVMLTQMVVMINQYRKRSIESFEVSHKTTVYFFKNQYLVESLSLYFLAALSSGMIKVPLSIYCFLSDYLTTGIITPKHL